MIAGLLAASAAVAGVGAAWEGLRALEEAATMRALGRVLAPLRRPDREPSVPERRRLALLGCAGLLAGGWLISGVLAGLLLAAAAPAIVGQVLAARRRRWQRALAASAATAARALADALASGHSARGALAQVGRAGAMPGPAGRELAEAARRLALGEPTEAVLDRLRHRANDPGWDAVVAAVLLHRDAGGDLARLLRTVAEAQEHAARVEADARGMTAQARASARLTAMLPFAGLAFGELLAPGSLAALLADPRSRLLLLAGLSLGFVALATIQRLGRVDDA